LRIHPDGGVIGTLGCIGLSGNATTLTNFYNALKVYFNNTSTSIRVIVNIP